MSETKPTIYLFHGRDELAIEEAIADLRQKLGESGSVDLNMHRFSSAELDITKLEAACASPPFLASRRLIILEHAEQVARSRLAPRLFELLLHLPQSTALVLLEPSDLDVRSKSKSEERGTSIILQWAQDHPSLAYCHKFVPPIGSAFVQWIVNRCRDMDGEIDFQAAQLLADWVAGDPRTAAQELSKLLDYVNRQRPISPSDVELLTPLALQADIFAMVDAVGQRKPGLALSHLQRLLQVEVPLVIFSMVIRQFRLLLQAREALDSGADPLPVIRAQIASERVAKQIASQARNFSLSHLERIYHNLLEIDLQSKTGKTDLQVALETLVADLAL